MASHVRVTITIEKADTPGESVTSSQLVRADLLTMADVRKRNAGWAITQQSVLNQFFGLYEQATGAASDE